MGAKVWDPIMRVQEHWGLGCCRDSRLEFSPGSCVQTLITLYNFYSELEEVDGFFQFGFRFLWLEFRHSARWI